MAWFGLLLVGLAAGVLGGTLGVSGGIVLIPAMGELFPPHQHLFQAAMMVVNFFVVIPAAWQHARAGAIDASVVRVLLPSSMAAVLAGVFVSERQVFSGDGQRYLVGLFGLFLWYAAGREAIALFQRESRSEPQAEPVGATPGWCAALFIGAPTGFVSGLLGVGGGVLAVPLQRRVLRLPLRRAIANSATTIIGLSLVGAPYKNFALVAHHGGHLSDSLRLAAVIAPVAMLGSLVGARLTHALPLRVVQFAFILLLLLCALRMSVRCLSGA